MTWKLSPGVLLGGFYQINGNGLVIENYYPKGNRAQ